MTLTLSDFNGMELFWDRLPKRPDDDHITLSQEDIDAMWESGIVDTKQYPITAWRDAFDVHRQADGTYVLSKEEFLSKETYRYKGEIMVPFDAMQINEGKYTDEGLNELFDASIAPSSSLSPAEIKKFLDDLKTLFREPNGLVKIGKEAKAQIRDMIEANPSPLRKLELTFDALINAQVSKGLPEGPGEFVAVSQHELSPEAIAKVQVSSFSMQPNNIGEEKWRALGKIEKRSKKAEKASIQDKASTTIKKAKRSRKGLRG